jgi:hypothetical protein
MRLRYLIPAAIAAAVTYSALVRDRDRSPGTEDLTGWDSLEPYRTSVATADAPAPAPPIAPIRTPVAEAPTIAERPTGYSADDEFLGLFPTASSSGPSVYDYLAGDVPAEADEVPEHPELATKGAAEESVPLDVEPSADVVVATPAPEPEAPAGSAQEPGPPDRTPEPTVARPDPIDWPIAAPAAVEPAMEPEPAAEARVTAEPTIPRPDPIDWPVAATTATSPTIEMASVDSPDGRERDEPPVDVLEPESPVAVEPTPQPVEEPAGIRVGPPDTAPAAGDEGRFALGGWAAASGHSVVSAVTFRRRLPQAVSAEQIELTIDASENVPEGGLIVLSDPGFAPDREGFTLLLTAADPGSFSAAGSYRVRV